MASVFDDRSVRGTYINKSDIGWNTQPYPESARKIVGTHLGNFRMESPVRMTPLRYLLEFVPRELPSIDSSLQYSHRLAYGHWGVGEKGPASRTMSEWLGTYEEQSRVDPHKAASYANIGGAIGLGIPILGSAGIAFSQSVGDPFIARSLASVFTTANAYPVFGLYYGIGRSIGAYIDYKEDNRSPGGIIRSLPFALHEIVSYPLSRAFGRAALSSPTARNIAGGIVSRGSDLYKWIGNSLDSSWFTNKAAEWEKDIKILEGIGNKAIPIGKLENKLGADTVRKLTPIFQEIGGPIIDIMAFSATRLVLNQIANVVDASYRSSRHAYGHAGVGEKGPASREQANRLGTYKDSSVVDVRRAAEYAERIVSKTVKRRISNPIKSAVLAEMKLASTYKNTAYENLDSIMRRVFDKYAVSKREISNWLRTDRLSSKLRKRGINLKEVSQELSASPIKSSSSATEQRVFLSPKEKKNLVKLDKRQIQSMLSGKEYSNRIAFDSTAVKAPEVYGKKDSALHTPMPEVSNEINIVSEPSMDSDIVHEHRQEAVISPVKSHVHVKISDGAVSTKKLDRILVRRLKRNVA
jgi:hypothetical protein